LTFQFGQWNDRDLNEGEARKLAEEMRDDVTRFHRMTYIMVPVDRTDFTSEGLEKLNVTRKLGWASLVRGSKHPDLPKVEDVLRKSFRRLTPTGGQHRQAALALHLDYCRKERPRLITKLSGHKEVMKNAKENPQTRRDAEDEAKATEVKLAKVELDLEYGGAWLFALYDKS
jgi:hypothetical protein